MPSLHPRPSRQRPLTRIFHARREISALRASTPALRACAQDHAQVSLEQAPSRVEGRVETCQSANRALTGAYKQERRSCEICGLSALLKASLRPARSLAIIGIGSDLRGDDIAGLLVLRHLRAALAHSHPKTIRLFNGGTAPENLTGEIIRFQPSHILLVDAAELGKKPGTVKLIAPETIGGVSFSTHVLPLSILADYLKRALSCSIIILGIQPGQTGFGSTPSREISQAARRLARIILKAAPLREAKKQRGHVPG